MIGKWGKLVGIIGAVGILSGAGILVNHRILPSTKVYSARPPKAVKTHDRLGHHTHATSKPHSVHSSPVTPSSAPSVQVTTSTSPAPAPSLLAFEGNVALEKAASFTLPRGYPIAANPVTFYTAKNFIDAESFAIILENQAFEIQLLDGISSSSVVLAIFKNGNPIHTAMFTAPVSIVAFTKERVVLEIMTKIPTWSEVNLITGIAMAPSHQTPIGVSPTNPHIQGISLTIPRDAIDPTSHASTETESLPNTSITNTLVNEVNTMLLTTTSPTQVVVSQSASDEATLTALSPTRWNDVTFDEENGIWVPISIETTVDGTNLTYVVSPTSVVLPYKELVALPKMLAQAPYTALDSQTAALAHLPINLENATVPGGPSSEGAPKIVLSDHGLSILALTYLDTVHGHTYFAPTGWYWWSGAPTFLKAPPSVSPPPSGPASSTAPSTTASP